MTTGAQARVHVDLESRGTGVVARVTIDNATKLNILGSALMAEFVAEVTALGAREDLRAFVLTGAGDRAFIGGANIHEMAALDAAAAREPSSPGCTGCARRSATCRCPPSRASTGTRSARGSKSRPLAIFGSPPRTRCSGCRR